MISSLHRARAVLFWRQIRPQFDLRLNPFTLGEIIAIHLTVFGFTLLVSYSLQSRLFYAGGRFFGHASREFSPWGQVVILGLSISTFWCAPDTSAADMQWEHEQRQKNDEVLN